MFSNYAEGQVVNMTSKRLIIKSWRNQFGTNKPWKTTAAPWKDLLPGDRILVNTKYGVKPVIITRIEWRDECPVNMRIKKVYKKVMES